MEQAITPAVLRVLHIEDMPDDAELIRYALEEAGYTLEYRRIETAAELRQAMQEAGWDVVLSDYGLPAFDPQQALGMLRQAGLDIPFILVSGMVGEEAAVALMKIGAHDFVMKDKLARLGPAIEREVKEADERRRRRAAEESVRVSEKLLRDITAALGEGLLVQDRNSQLMFMNGEAERLLGWSESELAQRKVHESIHFMHPDGTPFPVAECPVVNLVMQNGLRYQTDDDVFVRKNGAPFPVSYVTTPILEGGAVVGTVTAFQDISMRKQAEREVLDSRRQLQELSMFLQSVREDERTRIARELHDELGQALTALKIDLIWLNGRLASPEARITDKLSAMQGLIDKTVDSVRRIAEDLRPGMLDDLGLAAAIEHHVAKFIERAGIDCTLAMSHEDFTLENPVATALFRILQESLTNVARHAGASQARIQLDDLGAEMRLVIQDNGRGIPETPESGRKTYGLLGMRERAKILGGVLEISSQPGAGTRIEARIPKHADSGERA